MKLPILWCLNYKIWTYYHVLDLKRKTFAKFFLREVSNFYFKQNKQLLYYEKLHFIVTWTFPNIQVELFLRILLSGSF